MFAILKRLAFAAATILSIVSFPASATNYTVTTPDSNAPADGDGDGCTLRKALQNIFNDAQTFTDCAAPTVGGPNSIAFADASDINQSLVAGTFPSIKNQVTITGPKNIIGNGSDRIFNVSTSTGDLTITSMNFSNAKTAIRVQNGGKLSIGSSGFANNSSNGSFGGALEVDGSLNISGSTFSANSATQQGGAIYLSGTGNSSITTTNFFNNTATDDGGAIYVSINSAAPPATLAITTAGFQGNKASGAAGTKGGGAIHARSTGTALVSVVDSTFVANQADGSDGRGGAIYNGVADTNMVVDHCMFLTNSATGSANSGGGAIYSGDNMVVRSSSFISNDAGTGKGGAFAGDAVTPGGIELGNVLANVTMFGNTAAHGAAVYSFAQSGNRELKLVNVTIDSNTASTAGGGIFTEQFGAGTAITRLANTIVSNNTGGNCGGINVNNIIGNVQFPGATCNSDAAMTTGDPKLSGPAPNPPDVLTVSMSLGAGSAALRAGDNATCAAFPVLNADQRSLFAAIRPDPGGSNCDAGAYESSRTPVYASAPAVLTAINLLTLSGVPATQDVVISEGGDDDLQILNYGMVPAPATPPLSLSGPAFPFTVPDGGANQTLTLTCSSPTPASTSTTLVVNHFAAGSPAFYPVTCTVVDPIVITTASPLGQGVVGVPYSSFTFAASGGSGVYTNWAVTAGTPPPGFLLNPGTGQVTGTPTLAGVYNFDITVTDSNAMTGTKSFQVAIVDNPTITTASPLPNGTTGVAYPLTFAAAGGSGVYTNWAVTAGTAPPGLGLVAATGQVTGSPALAGIYNFDITVTDSNALTGTKSFQVTIVDPLVITSATPLPTSTVNVPYSFTFAATGGTPPYSNWQVVAGTPPPGVTLNPATGEVTGAVTVANTYNFTIQVQDSLGVLATKVFDVTINAAPAITTGTPLANGNQGTPYNLTFAATGGTPPYSNWQVTAGTPPPGVTLNPATGQVTGSPSAAGPFNFTIQVQDSVGALASKVFDVTITAPLTITTTSPLTDGVVGVPYPLTFAASGGTPAYSNWQVVAGTPPPGVTLNPATGQVTGSPTVAGPYSFTIQVQDSLGVTTTKLFTVTINAGLSITTATPLPAGTQGAPYSLTFAAAGGTPGYSNWQIIAGALPAGLTLANATGALTGTPTANGPFSFTVQTQDSTALTTTKAFTLTINPPVSITTATPLAAGTVGVPYSLTFAATGGTPPYSNWQVVAGTPPPGVSLVPATGQVTGSPTLAGPYSFTMQVQDSVGATTTKAFTVTINSALAITTATPLPAGTQGAPYNQTFAATGGTPGYSNWQIVAGALPAGLTLANATGALTGTPTGNGTFNFTVQVQDSTAATTTKAFQLTINASAITITTATPLPSGTVGTAYAGVTFAATGGTPPYVNWAVTAGALPAGLTLAAGTGVLSGTPTTAAGSPFGFTIQVTDNVGGTATKAFTLAVTGTGPAISTASPLPNGIVGTAYSQTFAATGGTTPYTNWAVTAGALPAGLTLAAGTGALTGTPTAAGTFNFTITVTDTASATGSKAFALTIGPACFSGAAVGGTAQACVAGGGPTCAFTPGTAKFIPVTGDPASPPAGSAPSGILFPQGLFAFSLSGCTPGSSVTLTVTYPAAIPAGAQYWKYGPQPSQPAPSWYILPATIAGTTATFTIVDGSLGDDDLLANGTIVDQGGPGVPGSGSGVAAEPTPTLSEWAMILLAMMMIAMAGRRRRGVAGR